MTAPRNRAFNASSLGCSAYSEKLATAMLAKIGSLRHTSDVQLDPYAAPGWCWMSRVTEKHFVVGCQKSKSYDERVHGFCSSQCRWVVQQGGIYQSPTHITRHRLMSTAEMPCFSSVSHDRHSRLVRYSHAFSSARLLKFTTYCVKTMTTHIHLYTSSSQSLQIGARRLTAATLKQS